MAGSCCLLATACAPGIPQTIPTPEISPQTRELYARRHLIDARLLVEQERYDSALRVIDRGLQLQPDNAKLHRLRGDVLTQLGRSEEAAQHFVQALELNPIVPLSMQPVIDPERARQITIVLLPPPFGDDPDAPWGPDRVPPEWPDGTASNTLEDRLATQLPGARVMTLDAATYVEHVQSIPGVRAWLAPQGDQSLLSIRVDRAFCGETAKDGHFAVAWLRVAIARGDSKPLAVETVRIDLDDPPDCRDEAIARALEAAFELPAVRDALELGASGNTWGHREVRRVFPRLDQLIQAEIDAGRELLSAGMLGRAAEHFRQASAIDPASASANSLLLDLEDTLSLSRELSLLETSNRPPGTWRRIQNPEQLSIDVHGQSSTRNRRAIEERLLEEQRQRDHLQAALAAYGNAQQMAPDSVVLTALRDGEIQDLNALGPRLARTLANESVERRTLYAPDGTVIVRYYFSGDAQHPVLGEADQDGDGKPDHWVAYSGALRSQAWEDDAGSGKPSMHMTYESDGLALKQVEIDRNHDGVMDQVLLYQYGLVHLESNDTTGDGRHDVVRHFDPEGDLSLREEDQNGDGAVDLRTHYRSGRLLRREILDPDAVARESPGDAATLESHKPL